MAWEKETSVTSSLFPMPSKNDLMGFPNYFLALKTSVHSKSQTKAVIEKEVPFHRPDTTDLKGQCVGLGAV